MIECKCRGLCNCDGEPCKLIKMIELTDEIKNLLKVGLRSDCKTAGICDCEGTGSCSFANEYIKNLKK